MRINQQVTLAEARCAKAFERIDAIALHNTERVLQAFQVHEVAARHFSPTTGYGYDDIGRDTLEAIFADLFGAEAAIVRPQIASGTHALSLCLFGLLLPGDELMCASGAPYDTLDGVIGISGCHTGSLREMGVRYAQVELSAEGRLDLPAIRAALTPHTKVVAVQRSRGYAARRSLEPRELEPLAAMLRAEAPHVCLMVDNCYGEFVDVLEPTHYGADVCVGSLIKNPGGGLAPTGGYVVGRNQWIERISYRLTAPSIGREVGSYAASYQPFYQGLFMAPHVVAQALRTATLASALFSAMGMKTTPDVDAPRTDLIQALELGTPERLIAFCQGIQSASPVDSMALPEPWAMPGYQEPVIMAAGTFVSGASIELSADAPMRPPYTAYLQGGLTYSHGKLALMKTLEYMQKKGCLTDPACEP
ncbi:MAG TPA: methionine gamma-lyase family protein [Candidatus Limiplasma sp.]|nr:methionine gamma-lyase family protein [Candidatus Limiplasma sp.]HPS81060.1 methionine gamma-lyase family protein [Candidatus Limiplasma sp.]